LGLVVNIAAFLALHNRDADDLNMRAATLHVLTDLFGSIAAIAAALIIASTGWALIDPLLSLALAALVGRSAIHLIRETAHILMQGAPPEIDVKELTSELSLAAPGIVGIHDLKVWQLTENEPCLTMHVQLDGGADRSKVLSTMKTILDERYRITSSTIQLDENHHCADCEASSVEMAPAALQSVETSQPTSSVRLAGGAATA
ncbi:MAG: cation diffusion facilitator family transporter, partial [Pseudomonadota bacterium]